MDQRPMVYGLCVLVFPYEFSFFMFFSFIYFFSFFFFSFFFHFFFFILFHFFFFFGKFDSVNYRFTDGPIRAWEWPGKPWIRIHIDYVGPFNGKMYLIVIDSYSKWIEIIPTTSATAEATVTILREIFSRWGLPLMIVSDNATCFTSYIFTDFCKHNAIKHITSSPHHPSTNGLAEEQSKCLSMVLKKSLEMLILILVIFCYIIEVAHRAQLGKHHLC